MSKPKELEDIDEYIDVVGSGVILDGHFSIGDLRRIADYLEKNYYAERGEE